VYAWYFDVSSVRFDALCLFVLVVACFYAGNIDLSDICFPVAYLFFKFLLRFVFAAAIADQT